ncbi:hypothetical protein I302_102466 [Kwoniella bestiolae CBS 10118]|uniref:Transmembrane protein n=1 Tax=Kwoniella bestiolae CBS 10118 TaxID=1296100 RepID=A0A1B9GF64_9TREE|nr:hypothetical protein I302_01156 [Kwoniella bestiolae CBS 10118]OCF29646.1 hypothetical protein I302_01156 [Kwoniella bestiolae CBS 10118]
MSSTTKSTRLIFSPIVFILVLLLIMAFMATPAEAAFNPVYMSYYCRQQCEQKFAMCARVAIQHRLQFI